MYELIFDAETAQPSAAVRNNTPMHMLQNEIAFVWGEITYHNLTWYLVFMQAYLANIPVHHPLSVLLGDESLAGSPATVIGSPEHCLFM